MSTIRDLFDDGVPHEPQSARLWGEAVSDAADQIPSSLDDLDDVDVDDPDEGDVLAYDGDDWVASGAYVTSDDIDDVVRSDDITGIAVVEEGDWPPDPELSGVLYIKVEDT